MRVNTLYSTKEIQTEQGQRVELRYYLVQDIHIRRAFRHRRREEDAGDEPGKEDLSAEDPLAENRITYGIRIIKMEGEQEEQECLPGLSTSMAAVECLLRQMIHGLVTPITAVEVADDWAAAQR